MLGMIGKADVIMLGLMGLVAVPILGVALAFGIHIAGAPASLEPAAPPVASRPTEARPDPNRFTQSDLTAMELLITSRGFSCRKATRMRDMLFGGGFVVHCDDRPGVEYWFNVEDHGGKWTVESKGFGQ
jgi:hypothetical protein